MKRKRIALIGIIGFAAVLVILVFFIGGDEGLLETSPDGFTSDVRIGSKQEEKTEEPETAPVEEKAIFV